jgi:hypothetical protein
MSKIALALATALSGALLLSGCGGGESAVCDYVEERWARGETVSDGMYLAYLEDC